MTSSLYLKQIFNEFCVTICFVCSCTAIPEAFLDKIIAKKHFSQFGRIRNFILRPNKYSCIVQYENADDAEAAFHMGRIYNGIAFNVELIEDPIPVQQYDNFIDPDVQDELDAMENVPKKSATNSISRGKKFVCVFPR